MFKLVYISTYRRKNIKERNVGHDERESDRETERRDRESHTETERDRDRQRKEHVHEHIEKAMRAKKLEEDSEITTESRQSLSG